MIGREACLRLLKTVVQESPADQTEALLLTEDSSLTRFAQSADSSACGRKERNLILRVVLGKKIAVVTTNILRPFFSERPLLKRRSPLPRFSTPTRPLSPCRNQDPFRTSKRSLTNISRLTPSQKAKMIKDLSRC